MLNNNFKISNNPLIHISRRTDIKPLLALALRVTSVGVALLLCGIISYAITKNNFGAFYKELFNGTFGSKIRILNMFEEIAILLCISLAVTPAFKMKFWNIGAEGQVLMGALMTATCMLYLKTYMADAGIIIISLIVSICSGIIWAVIPALFKAKWNTNETLFTLMMNYVAMKIVKCLLSIFVKSGSGVITTKMMMAGRLPLLGGYPYIINIIVVMALTILLSIYLKYSKHGYELTVVGESINTAKYIGVSVKKVLIRTMVLSGAICGIAGFLIVSGASYTVNDEIVAGRGFTAILVSWLAYFNPYTMIVTSFLVVFLQKGAASVASVSGLGTPYPELLTGVFFICIIAVEFFVTYKVSFRKLSNKNKVPKASEVSSATKVLEEETKIIEEEKKEVQE